MRPNACDQVREASDGMASYLGEYKVSEAKILKWIGWSLVAIGVLMAVSKLIIGIDLTEDQLVVQTLQWWISSLGCLLGGYAIINNSISR
jgi:hypothetical protein